jgi:hypothetical protein
VSVQLPDHAAVSEFCDCRYAGCNGSHSYVGPGGWLAAHFG